MKLLMRILIGFGTMVAGFLGLLVLAKNETVSERLKIHYEEALAAGREAAAARRAELENEVAKMNAETDKKE